MTVLSLFDSKMPETATLKHSKGTPLPISATVITHNEAQRVEDCLASLSGFVDQIVVLDSGSVDQTREIALGMGAEVHIADWQGYGPQKRRAEELCKHDWILSLDADERLSPALTEEIRRAFAGGEPPVDAFTVSIVDQLPHESKPARWAYFYRRIRLYNLRRGRFADSAIHDDIIMKKGSRVGDLEGRIPHLSLEGLSEATAKFNRYTDIQAEAMQENGRQLPRWRLVTEFPVAFLKSYFLRRRFMYGFWGFIFSMTYANMRFLRVAKAYETRHLPSK